MDTPRFTFQAAPIAGLWIVDRKPIGDNRGSFTRFYCGEEFAAIGLQDPIVQINHSSSARAGTVRGLHFQHAPHAETKVVTCVAGSILDVAVDLRAGSPTFLQWFGVELSADNKRGLIIPPGFAHGFQSLEDHSEVMYLVTAAYSAQFEDGLSPFDPAVGVVWPLPPTEVSARDAQRPFIDRDAYAGVAAQGADR
ncbi:dTDP-4-dehydrorhamnose 3,5-epimerase [Pigmentiphaga aceris]|uniref:dTDP-4-dehydrorhamnose 3,5-epimerase n=1 Tax=Pigmentiphaga aceris TaxID=1940612 RepID=A0A5C0B608_9BURK|nr:dTDP-4-dehydrorhamnose 3,5-epimerase [Pigmentiphaga aceris]